MPTYNVDDYGAMNNGDPNSAPVNTTAIQNCFNAAANMPGPVEFSMGAGYAVLNGRLQLPAPNMKIFGHASMGSVPDWGPTSLITGYGAGDTISVLQGGSTIRGLAFRCDGQSGKEAVIKIIETQVTVDDCYFDSPNIGISVLFPYNMGGQSWLSNILMGGMIKVSGMDISAGNAAVKLSHIRMFNGDMSATTTQPAYGVVVRAAGEFMMSGSCDIDNCGVNLAIIPGSDGIANTWVQNISIVNCDFDNGNGAGQILIRPRGSSFILNANLSNVWCSSVNNGNGAWPGNGVTIDGSMSHPAAGFPSICNVSIGTSVFQNSVRHCGVYAKSVQGLGIVNSTAGGNYVGFQTYGCTGVFSALKAGAYVPAPLGQQTGGNATYGVLIEKSNIKFNPNDNALDGNGVPPGWKVIP